MQPRRDLPVDAPARLAGHEIASATWRRMMRQYNELEAQIVTRLDQDLLIDYCILMEQLAEMDEMRQSCMEIWKLLEKRRVEIQAEDPEKAIDLAVSALHAFDDIAKLDSRVDRKRTLLHKWRQSMYIDPRARAGAAPKEKEKEQPMDEMEKLLGNVTQFVNSGSQDEGK